MAVRAVVGGSVVSGCGTVIDISVYKPESPYSESSLPSPFVGWWCEGVCISGSVGGGGGMGVLTS